jgi:hypothetical protein
MQRHFFCKRKRRSEERSNPELQVPRHCEERSNPENKNPEAIRKNTKRKERKNRKTQRCTILRTKAESLPVNSAGHRPAALLRSSIPKALPIAPRMGLWEFETAIRSQGVALC